LELPIDIATRVAAVLAFTGVSVLAGVWVPGSSRLLFVFISSVVCAGATSYPMRRYFAGSINLHQRTTFSWSTFRRIFGERFPIYAVPAIGLTYVGLRFADDTGVGSIGGILARAHDPFVGGAILGASFALISAYQVAHGREDDQPRTLDMSGVRRSTSAALKSMAITAPVVGLFAWLIFGPVFGAPVAALVTVALFERNGGRSLIRHLVLRAEAKRNGLVPWRLGRFMDSLCDIGLMRRATRGYLFVHSSVREYLAGQPAPDNEQAALSSTRS
jgi:hypothetical protein